MNAWEQNSPLPIELMVIPKQESTAESHVSLLISRWEESDYTLTPEQLCVTQPELLDLLRRRLANLRRVEAVMRDSEPGVAVEPVAAYARLFGCLANAPKHLLARVLLAMYKVNVLDIDAGRADLTSIASEPDVRGSNQLMALLLALRAGCNHALGKSGCNHALGKSADERRDVAESILHAPDDNAGRSLMGRLLLEDGHYALALKHLDVALIANARLPYVLIYRGWCQLYLSNASSALDDFESAYHMQPGNIAAKFGATYAAIKKVASQITNAGRRFRALYLHPTIPAAKLNCVLATYAKGQLTEHSCIALLSDNTLWGSARDGFSISEDKLMAHSRGEKRCFAVRLADIREVVVSSGFLGPRLRVNGISLPCRQIASESQGDVCRMLLDLGTLHRRLDGYDKRMSNDGT